LQDELSFKRIEEHLHDPSLQLKISDLEKVFKNKVCSDLPNAFWERKRHIILFLMNQDLTRKIFQPKLDQHK